MSRSYRKPYATDGYGGNYRRHAKKQANKKVRRSFQVSDGKAYKRYFCSYNICDYRFYVKENAKPWKFHRK